MEEMNRSNRPGVGFTCALYHVVFSLYRIFCTKKPALTPVSEVPSRFELENKGFADLRLTAWLWHQIKWSGRRDSDPRHPPWQGGTLPTELLPHIWGTGKLCGRRDSNSYAFRHQILSLARLPFRHARRTDPAMAGKSDPLEIRTPDTLIKSQVLCQLS